MIMKSNTNECIMMEANDDVKCFSIQHKHELNFSFELYKYSQQMDCRQLVHRMDCLRSPTFFARNFPDFRFSIVFDWTVLPLFANGKTKELRNESIRSDVV